MPAYTDPDSGLPGYRLEEASDSEDRTEFAEKAAYLTNPGIPAPDPDFYLRQSALQLAVGRHRDETPEATVARAAAYLAFLKGPAT